MGHVMPARRAGARTRAIVLVAVTLVATTLVSTQADAARSHRVTVTKTATVSTSATRVAHVDGHRGEATVRRSASGRGSATVRATTRQRATSLATAKARQRAVVQARKRAFQQAAAAAARLAASRAREAAAATEPTPTPTPTPEPTVSPTPTPEPTVSPTPTPEPTVSPTPTPEPTASPTPTPTATTDPAPEPVDGCGAVRRKADGSAWTCTFADDFDGSDLDRTKWSPATTESTGLTYGDCWVDRPENLSVADGALRLTTRKEAEPQTCTAGGSTVTTRYTSASVTTWGKYTMDHGRVEVRAKMPATATPGVHSALWLFPQTLEYWDAGMGTGELDIAEFYSQYPDRLIPTVHYATSSRDYTNYFCLVQDPTAWHTYALEWDRERIRVVYDGQVCLDHRIRSTDTSRTDGQPFDQDYTINLTQMLGVGANEPTSGTRLPATLQVDWVRAWQ